MTLWQEYKLIYRNAIPALCSLILISKQQQLNFSLSELQRTSSLKLFFLGTSFCSECCRQNGRHELRLRSLSHDPLCETKQWRTPRTRVASTRFWGVVKIYVFMITWKRSKTQEKCILVPCFYDSEWDGKDTNIYRKWDRSFEKVFLFSESGLCVISVYFILSSVNFKQE